MTTLREAAQQALERLIVHHRTWDARDDLNAITALRAALEQPTRAQKIKDAGYTRRTTLRGMAEPEQEPLSDEELDRLWREPMSADWEHREYARAIEAAHGIKENT
jgi:hypothetical protein